MPPDSVWSDQFNKSEIQLNLRGTGWKNLMNNCLIQAEIFKGNENKNGSCIIFDPNTVMNMRHKMIKELPKYFPTSREQTQSEAFKLLREEYHDRLLRHKEERLVEKEILKLRQILENHRLIIKKKLEQTIQKDKVPPPRTSLTKSRKKLPKALESCDTVRRMDAWLGCSLQVSAETKISRQELPGKHVSMKSQQQTEEISDLVTSRKGSMIEGEGEQENEFWEDKRKDEIMRFLESDRESLELEFRDDVKEEIKVDRTKEKDPKENQKNIGCALRKWKNRDECKNKSTENKIEIFLSRLKEKNAKREKGMAIKVGSKVKRKIWEKREKDERTDDKLKELMQEVKSSQKEAHQKLQEAKTSIKTENKFLLRMEERRKERMKRRRVFEERKLKLEEEKENIQRQREEEKKQKDEQEKRKRLEELKEKRRAEKEKKEEDKREKERLKVSAGIAAAHQRIYLLRGYGLRPWTRLMRMRESQQQEAMKFFERRLKERTLSRWIARVREQTELKVKCAASFYEGILKKNCLVMWMEFYQKRLRQHQVAVDWYDFKITETFFKIWLQFTKAQQHEYRIQRDLAVKHHQQKLKLKYMQKLRNYPIMKRLEEAKENRKWKWRQKVKEILPDYEPVHISENF